MFVDECFKNIFWSWGVYLMKRLIMLYIILKEEENGVSYIFVKFKYLKRF